MLEEVAKDAWEYGRKFLLQGKVADYIPELGKANPVHFGLCIKTEDGRHIEFGDSECRFTIQSICKIVSLAAALQYIGEEKVFKNVMMDPSGDAFKSILKLDTASNRPFNPMINAGAVSLSRRCWNLSAPYVMTMKSFWMNPSTAPKKRPATGIGRSDIC